MAEPRQALVPIIDRHGEDLFLTGHDHTYQRTYLTSRHRGDRTHFDPQTHGRYYEDGTTRSILITSGTVYTESGTDGVSRPEGNFTHPAFVRLHGGENPKRGLSIPGSLLLGVRPGELSCKQIGSGGPILDQFRLRKSARPQE